MGYSKIFAVLAGLAIVATDFQSANAAMMKRFEQVETVGTVTQVHHERIIGGVIAGAFIGGAIVHHRNRRYHKRYYRKRYYRHRYRPVYSRGDAHVGWCHRRYRSYRAYDNTFQPYHGRRRQCISPYY
ncbi:MAG: BA14K family protein [Hyphomicrobiales bacterium]|nr:BA14K family protein [Hyphomicrobiales bacterium]